MVHRNLNYQGYNQKESLYDLFIAENAKHPLLVFVHGYMGYKDWGAWNLLAEKWMQAGYSVAKLNLSHNGTTVEQPTEFADLEAFGNNSYWKELTDVQLFLDVLEQEHHFTDFILVGHSRGGGIVLLAGLDQRVKQLHCLAPISSIINRFPKNEAMQSWKEEDVYYRKNGRTNQELPHFYSQFEEFEKHQDHLTIETACKKLNKPVFVYHGELDESVLPSEGKQVSQWSGGDFYLIKNTAHTFDTKEPWEQTTLSSKMLEVLELMFQNFKVK